MPAHWQGGWTMTIYLHFISLNTHWRSHSHVNNTNRTSNQSHNNRAQNGGSDASVRLVAHWLSSFTSSGVSSWTSPRLCFWRRSWTADETVSRCSKADDVFAVSCLIDTLTPLTSSCPLRASLLGKPGGKFSKHISWRVERGDERGWLCACVRVYARARVCVCIYQLTCFTPPSRCCFSSMNLAMAFFRSRTVAFCTTTMALGGAIGGNLSITLAKLQRAKHPNTYALLHHQPSALWRSWPGRTPKRSENSPPPGSPDSEVENISSLVLQN